MVIFSRQCIFYSWYFFCESFSTPPFFWDMLWSYGFFSGSVIHYHHCSFLCSNCPNLAYVSSFKMAPLCGFLLLLFLICFLFLTFSWVFEHFLVSGTTRYSGSPCSLVLESAASPRNPGSFLHIITFTNCAANCAYCYWDVITQGPVSGKRCFPFC